MTLELPDNCLKGVPNSDFVNPDGSMATHLFYFDGDERLDGQVDQSINWEDDDEAIPFTLEQRRTNDGQIQFRAGLAVIPKSQLDRLKSLPVVGGHLGYERDEKDDNRYHGNILLSSSIEKPRMRQIAASIALAVVRHVTA